MDKYRGEASVKNWLFVILKSKITDHLRKQHSKATMQAIYLEHNDNMFFDEQDHWRKGMYPKQWTVDFNNTVETKEFYKVFRSCSGKLKELQNTVFVMKYVDGMDSFFSRTMKGFYISLLFISGICTFFISSSFYGSMPPMELRLNTSDTINVKAVGSDPR